MPTYYCGRIKFADITIIRLLSIPVVIFRICSNCLPSLSCSINKFIVWIYGHCHWCFATGHIERAFKKEKNQVNADRPRDAFIYISQTLKWMEIFSKNKTNCTAVEVSLSFLTICYYKISCKMIRRQSVGYGRIKKRKWLNICRQQLISKDPEEVKGVESVGETAQESAWSSQMVVNIYRWY